MGIQYGATLRATGTAPPAWTISGTATRQVGLHLEIDSVAGGTGLGQATYKWSEDNGSTYVATGVLTAAGPTALGTTGLSVAMAVGPYNIDNKWDVTVAQWNDQSGLGNHAVQATAANQPLFILASGAPRVDFKLVGNLQMTLTQNIVAPSGISVIAGLNAASASGGRGAVFTSKEWAVSLLGAGGAWSMFTTVDSLATLDVKDGAPHIISALLRAANDIDLISDGALINRVNGSGAQARTVTGIGGNGSPNTHNLLGGIGELIVFSTACTSVVEKALRNGIKARAHGVAYP
jgi:hypothetical protein